MTVRIEFLGFYNDYHDQWIEGPFTQEWITRFASSCSYTVICGLLDQIGMEDRELGGQLKNCTLVGLMERDVPRTMRTLKDSVASCTQERWFWYYWHSAARYKTNRALFDYFRTAALQFAFVQKLPTFEEYPAWSARLCAMSFHEGRDHCGIFRREDLQPCYWNDTKSDPLFHAQFAWIGKEYGGSGDTSNKPVPNTLPRPKKAKPSSGRARTLERKSKAELVAMVLELEGKVNA